MPLTYPPSQAAYTWDTEMSATIPDVAPILIDNHKDVMPTLKLLRENTKEHDLGPDEKFNYNMLTDMQDTYGMSRDQVFEYKRLDPVTRQEWTPKKVYSSAGINTFDYEHYKNSGRSLVDLAQENILAIRKGLTWRFNYDLWSKWNELDNNTLEINLNTTLAALSYRNPPRTTLKYIAPDDRFYSIPMMIRKDVTHHTIGNVDSRNADWQPYVVDANTDVARSTTGINIDVVTDDSVNPVEIDMDIIYDFLSAMQKGGGYKLYVCTPNAIYNYLAQILVTERRRTPDDDHLRADLGIAATITLEEYNATFYMDPIANALYPYSLWFWDPECMFYLMDTPFNPRVVPWEPISGTNQMGTVAYYNGQLVSPDRVGLGALHGYKAAS